MRNKNGFIMENLMAGTITFISIMAMFSAMVYALRVKAAVDQKEQVHEVVAFHLEYLINQPTSSLVAGSQTAVDSTYTPPMTYQWKIQDLPAGWGATQRLKQITVCGYVPISSFYPGVGGVQGPCGTAPTNQVQVVMVQGYRYDDF